jgi:hypothetical protein
LSRTRTTSASGTSGTSSTGRGCRYGRMVQNTRGSGNTGWLMAVGVLCNQTARSMTEPGLMIRWRDLGGSGTPMALYTRESGAMTSSMERERRLGRTIASMRGSSSLGLRRGMV